MIVIKLDKILETKGIAQRELARRTGIRRPTINEMCQNKAKSLPIENLDKLCAELECDLSDLLEYKKEPAE